MVTKWFQLYKNNNKIIYFMPFEKNTPLKGNQMEAAFVASSTLKRNKRYIDINKINDLEQESRVLRRRPLSSSKNAEVKINNSFSNSTNAYTERLEKDIHRFKTRSNTEERPFTARTTSHHRTTSQQSNYSQKSIKGLGIGQHLSRQQYYSVRQKPVLDERLFNNFSLDKPDLAHTVNLERGPQRNFDNSHKHINTNIEYETHKLYQDYYYKRTTMDCRLHYKKEKQEERYYFKPTRSENKPATDLSPKAVKKAEEFADKKQGPIDSFYMNSGRELPCQLQARSGTKLTSHWRNENEEIDRPNIEYSVRFLKERLQISRKQRIKESKKPHFKRNEICDKKYFIFNSQKV